MSNASNQCYVPAGLTASTHRSDFYFDGDEFDEFHEVIDQWTSRSVKCQVYRERIECADGTFYAEVHHIRPLGGNHGEFPTPAPGTTPTVGFIPFLAPTDSRVGGQSYYALTYRLPASLGSDESSRSRFDWSPRTIPFTFTMRLVCQALHHFGGIAC